MVFQEKIAKFVCLWGRDEGPDQRSTMKRDGIRRDRVHTVRFLLIHD